MTRFNSDRVLAIARRQAFVLQRAPQRWFDVIVWPVVDAILFGAIGVYFGEQVADGGTGRHELNEWQRIAEQAPAKAAGAKFPAVYQLFANRFYIDDFYQWTINNLVLGFARVVAFFDRGCRQRHGHRRPRPGYATASAGSSSTADRQAAELRAGDGARRSGARHRRLFGEGLTWNRDTLFWR